MNRNQPSQRLSRLQETFTVPASGHEAIDVSGDYYRIAALSGDLEISVNDGPFSDCELGMRQWGVAGRGDVDKLKFRNVSLSPATVTVIHGRGEYQNQSSVEATLTASDIAAINPAASSLTPGLTVATGSGTVAAGKRMVSIYVVTGPVTVLSQTLDTGLAVEFVAPGRIDTVGAIDYDASGGSILIATLG